TQVLDFGETGALVSTRRDLHHRLAMQGNRGDDLVQELLRDFDARPKVDVAIRLGQNREPVAQSYVVVAEARSVVERVPTLLRLELVDEVAVVVGLLSVARFHSRTNAGKE